MDELVEIMLCNSAEIECLVDSTSALLGTVVFSNLLKLTIEAMKCMEFLCRGLPPCNLFAGLEELRMKRCYQMKGISSAGNLNLCSLKVLELHDCPMFIFLFTPAVAQTLVRLEVLIVTECHGLKCIVVDEEEEKDGMEKLEQKNHGLVFSKLKEIVIQNCEGLEYVFGQNLEDQSSYQNGKKGTRIIGLPLFDQLKLEQLSNMVGIFSANYCVKCPKWYDVYVSDCPHLDVAAINNWGVGTEPKQQDHTVPQDYTELRQEDHNTTKDQGTLTTDSWFSKKLASSRQLEDTGELLKETLKSLLAKKEYNGKQVQWHKHKDTTSTYKYWTNRVSEIAAEANKLIDTYDGQRIRKWKIWERSRISKKIAKMQKKIESLEKGCPEDFLVDKMPEPVLKEFDVPQITEYPTLQGCLKSILDFLKNSNIKVIVVEGIKGVGKTTILRNLNNNEEVTNLFDMVIFTRVGSAQINRKFYRVIAERLMVDNEAMKSPDEVAGRIRMELENKRYLLILDDIVNPIKLEELGIPHNNNGSKVVMATQFPDVFKSNKVQRLITVEKLLPDEAWKMFQTITEPVIDFPDVKQIARIVCNRCSRLPLLINIIASTFKLKDSASSWRAGLEDLKPWPELQCPGVEELYSCLRSCYDELKDKNRQKCFLYTSLYPADSKVYSDYLVECWAAHGFLGDVNNTRRYQNARDQGNDILEHLTRVSLLEKGKGMKYVRMNDCIKQFALHISRLETSESAGWDSMIGQKLRALPTNPDGRMRSTLLLQKNPELVAIPPEFFESMSNLILLDLHGTGIGQLPSSISELTNLKGLYLNDCRLLIMFPIEIKSLQNLEVLDIRGTGVTFIPSHLKYLTNLRCLRISYDTNHFRDENVEADHNVISELYKLEQLVIEVISYTAYTQWGNDAEHVMQQVASLTNLSMLVCSFPSSSILQIFLEKSESWRNHLQFNSFRFFVGCESSKCHQIVDSLEYGINNYMKYCNGEMNDDLAVTQILPRTVAFELVCHKDITILSNWDGATTLNGIRSFLIERCNKMQTLVSGKLHDNIASILPTLEHLYLDNLLHFERAFRGPLHPRTLSKLKTLTLRNCPMLDIIFFQVANENFSELEKLTIQDCHVIKEIIIDNENENQRDMLPKLEMLVLDGLPNLSVICKDEILAWPSLVSLHIRRCPQLKTLPFGMEGATNLRFIKGEQQWWNSLDWTDKSMERFQSIFAASNN